MNEAGKTIFLQSLEKSNDALGIAKFNPVDDYPRKDLPAYLKIHDKVPSDVTVLTYALNKSELIQINNEFHTNIKEGFKFSVTYNYQNMRSVGISVDEKPVISFLLANSTLSSDISKVIKKAKSIREIPTLVKDIKSYCRGQELYRNT